MECPKCHTKVKDNVTICPKCHKVLALKCPNCGAIGESPVCENCGYTILVKCSKCSKLYPVEKELCPKCKFPLKTSLAYQECESDEFASIIIKFGSLKKIKKILKSQELYSKFFYRLKNLLTAQIKGIECNYITYNDIFVINMCKELSLATSSNKAVKLALKIVNSFVSLNNNIMLELGIPLNLSVSIVKKQAENLQELNTYENNVKLLAINKAKKKYLKGIELVLDQYVRDEISKDYKTDSLYSVENNGKTIMFYEVILDSYVLPPEERNDEEYISIKPPVNDKKIQNVEQENADSFKVFDINAKCTFERLSPVALLDSLKTKISKIISIRAENENKIDLRTLQTFFESMDYRVLTVSCTEELLYKPWGFFESLFRDYYGIPCCNNLNQNIKINPKFKTLYELTLGIPSKALTNEDARYNYIDLWNKFLSSLSKTVVIIDGFEMLDESSIQTIELYFDKFKKIIPNFVFITAKETSVHSKIKGLIRTPHYTEYVLTKTTMDECLSTIKADAKDFIQSFYFEKIKENFNGSYLYFQNAINYLKDCGIILEFENKLLMKSKKSVMLPIELNTLLKTRIKYLSKNMNLSLILAYSSILGRKLDFQILSLLDIKDATECSQKLSDSSLAYIENNEVCINNYTLVLPIIKDSLKESAVEFLAKNIIAKLGKTVDNTTLALLMGKLGIFKEEYLLLWKNSQFAIKTGDYDSYLKNCLGFLSLIEHVKTNISEEDVDNHKKEVYNNILLSLYNYSPAKIYFIENILLMDAINKNDNENIIKLSNLMLQGALIQANYTDSLKLLHNILSRMPNPTLKVNGAVNTKFLLLSLVHIEILYNIGELRTCADIAEDILSVLNPEILEKVKPASFSTNLFVSHILETCRLAAFAKLMLMDEDLNEFFAKIAVAVNAELPEAECIIAIKDFLAGKVYSTGNVEEASPFSKVIYLILQEFSHLKDNYKTFAQNIYQAKLLALDLHQKELELLCDLLIAYAYSKIGNTKKANLIYDDVLLLADKSAIFNILMTVKFLKALCCDSKDALLIINDSLAILQKNNNQSKIFYALFEKLYITIAEQENITAIDIESEKQKLQPFTKCLSKLVADNIE